MANVERDRTLRTLRAKVVRRRADWERDGDLVATGVTYGLDEALRLIDEELGIPEAERGRAS